MARQLTGVDIIIGGDSHILLGDFADLGKNTAGPYPPLVTGADGNMVCIAQAWQYSQIVGKLTVSFDNQGIVTNYSGTPHIWL